MRPSNHFRLLGATHDKHVALSRRTFGKSLYEDDFFGGNAFTESISSNATLADGKSVAVPSASIHFAFAHRLLKEICSQTHESSLGRAASIAAK